MSDYVVAGHGFAGKAGKQHRLFARYLDGFLPLIWFRVGKDGSLYIGPYVPDADGVKSGTVKADELGSISVAYDDGIEFRIAGGEATKVSFHASGVMHYDRKRGFTPPLADRDYREPVCIILPAEPKLRAIKSAAEIRTSDIVTGHVILDDVPSHLFIFYSIGPKHEFREIAKTEWKTFVRYNQLERVGSATLEVSLSQNGGGVWPPHAYIVARADPDNTSSKSTNDDDSTPFKPRAQ